MTARSSGVMDLVEWQRQATDWQLQAARNRQESRDFFEYETNYAGAGGSGVQSWMDPQYRAGLPSVAEEAPISSPAAFVSQGSAVAGTVCLDGFDCCFTTSCSAFCNAFVFPFQNSRRKAAQVLRTFEELWTISDKLSS